jgi:hypothetical protein
MGQRHKFPEHFNHAAAGDSYGPAVFSTVNVIVDQGLNILVKSQSGQFDALVDHPRPPIGPTKL